MYNSRLYYIDVLLNNPIKLMEIINLFTEDNTFKCTIIVDEDDNSINAIGEYENYYERGFYFYIKITNFTNISIYDIIIHDLEYQRKDYIDKYVNKYLV